MLFLTDGMIHDDVKISVVSGCGMDRRVVGLGVGSWPYDLAAASFAIWPHVPMPRAHGTANQRAYVRP